MFSILTHPADESFYNNCFGYPYCFFSHRGQPNDCEYGPCIMVLGPEILTGVGWGLNLKSESQAEESEVIQ